MKDFFGKSLQFVDVLQQHVEHGMAREGAIIVRWRRKHKTKGDARASRQDTWRPSWWGDAETRAKAHSSWGAGAFKYKGRGGCVCADLHTRKREVEKWQHESVSALAAGTTRGTPSGVQRQGAHARSLARRPAVAWVRRAFRLEGDAEVGSYQRKGHSHATTVMAIGAEGARPLK